VVWRRSGCIDLICIFSSLFPSSDDRSANISLSQVSKMMLAALARESQKFTGYRNDLTGLLRPNKLHKLNKQCLSLPS
jgi:hypothetical protein